MRYIVLVTILQENMFYLLYFIWESERPGCQRSTTARKGGPRRSEDALDIGQGQPGRHHDEGSGQGDNRSTSAVPQR